MRKLRSTFRARKPQKMVNIVDIERDKDDRKARKAKVAAKRKMAPADSERWIGSAVRRAHRGHLRALNHRLGQMNYHPLAQDEDYI